MSGDKKSFDYYSGNSGKLEVLQHEEGITINTKYFVFLPKDQALALARWIVENVGEK